MKKIQLHHVAVALLGLVVVLIALALSSCITLPPGSGVQFGTTKPAGIGSVTRRIQDDGTDIRYRTLEPIGAGRVSVKAVENGFEATIWDKPEVLPQK